MSFFIRDQTESTLPLEGPRLLFAAVPAENEYISLSLGAETNVSVEANLVATFMPDTVLSDAFGSSGTAGITGGYNLVSANINYEYAKPGMIGYSVALSGGLSLLPVSISGYWNTTNPVGYEIRCPLPISHRNSSQIKGVQKTPDFEPIPTLNLFLTVR